MIPQFQRNRQKRVWLAFTGASGLCAFAVVIGWHICLVIGLGLRTPVGLAAFTPLPFVQAVVAAAIGFAWGAVWHGCIAALFLWNRSLPHTLTLTLFGSWGIAFLLSGALILAGPSFFVIGLAVFFVLPAALVVSSIAFTVLARWSVPPIWALPQQCPACSYNLAGLPPDSVCPECAAHRADSAATPRPTIRETLPRRVDAFIACAATAALAAPVSVAAASLIPPHGPGTLQPVELLQSTFLGLVYSLLCSAPLGASLLWNRPLKIAVPLLVIPPVLITFGPLRWFGGPSPHWTGAAISSAQVMFFFVVVSIAQALFARFWIAPLEPSSEPIAEPAPSDPATGLRD